MCWPIILAQCFIAIYVLTPCYHVLNIHNRKKTRAALTLASDSGHKPPLLLSNLKRYYRKNQTTQSVSRSVTNHSALSQYNSQQYHAHSGARSCG